MKLLKKTCLVNLHITTVAKHVLYHEMARSPEQTQWRMNIDSRYDKVTRLLAKWRLLLLTYYYFIGFYNKFHLSSCSMRQTISLHNHSTAFTTAAMCLLLRNRLNTVFDRKIIQYRNGTIRILAKMVDYYIHLTKWNGLTYHMLSCYHGVRALMLSIDIKLI